MLCHQEIRPKTLQGTRILCLCHAGWMEKGCMSTYRHIHGNDGEPWVIIAYQSCACHAAIPQPGRYVTFGHLVLQSSGPITQAPAQPSWSRSKQESVMRRRKALVFYPHFPSQMIEQVTAEAWVKSWKSASVVLLFSLDPMRNFGSSPGLFCGRCRPGNKVRFRTLEFWACFGLLWPSQKGYPRIVSAITNFKLLNWSITFGSWNCSRMTLTLSWFPAAALSKSSWPRCFEATWKATFYF